MSYSHNPLSEDGGKTVLLAVTAVAGVKKPFLSW